MARWKHFLATAVIGLGLCGGCAKTFTRQQYETIYKGQPAWANGGKDKEAKGPPPWANNDKDKGGGNGNGNGQADGDG